MSDNDFLVEMTVEHDALQLAEAGQAMREVLQTLSTPSAVAAREWWDVVHADHLQRVEGDLDRCDYKFRARDTNEPKDDER